MRLVVASIALLSGCAQILGLDDTKLDRRDAAADAPNICDTSAFECVATTGRTVCGQLFVAGTGEPYRVANPTAQACTTTEGPCGVTVTGQSAATFFKDEFYYETESTAGEFFTGDRELSPVRNVTVGAKLTLISVGGEKPVWGLFDKLQFNLRTDVLFLDLLAADDTAANTGGIDSQFIYGNSLIDAVTIQLGLLGNY